MKLKVMSFFRIRFWLNEYNKREETPVTITWNSIFATHSASIDFTVVILALKLHFMQMKFAFQSPFN